MSILEKIEAATKPKMQPKVKQFKKDAKTILLAKLTKKFKIFSNLTDANVKLINGKNSGGIAQVIFSPQKDWHMLNADIAVMNRLPNMGLRLVNYMSKTNKFLIEFHPDDKSDLFQ